MIALVFGVIAKAIRAGSMQYVSGSMSTKTGFAPTKAMTFAVAANVKDGTITSSPGPIPSEIKHKWSAEVPEFTATQSRSQNELVGFNLRMTDIHAAIGRVQLKKLVEMTDKRIENANYLSLKLESEFLPIVPTNFVHVFHQYTVRVQKNREDFSAKLSLLGIGNDVYYPTQVHKLRSFSSRVDLPETELATKEVLSLPVHPGLKKKDLRNIVYAFNSVQEEVRKIV